MLSNFALTNSATSFAVLLSAISTVDVPTKPVIVKSSSASIKLLIPAAVAPVVPSAAKLLAEPDASSTSVSLWYAPKF